MHCIKEFKRYTIYLIYIFRINITESSGRSNTGYGIGMYTITIEYYHECVGEGISCNFSTLDQHKHNYQP